MPHSTSRYDPNSSPKGLSLRQQRNDLAPASPNNDSLARGTDALRAELSLLVAALA